MRILFLTNLYPPVGNGGFEKWCQEVADGFHQRGHAVTVLTTHNRRDQVRRPEPDWVYRVLHMEMEFGTLVHSMSFFTSRRARQQENLACLRQHMTSFNPDLVFIWGMWNLHHSLPVLAEQLLPGRVVYYMADYWPTLPSQHELYWQAPAQNWMNRLPKGVLKPIARHILNREQPAKPQFSRVIFPSTFLRDEFARLGVPAHETAVILGAIDTRPFGSENGFGSRAAGSAMANGSAEERPFSLLYAGRLSPEKGIETALAALSELVRQPGLPKVRLAIAGTGERGYENQLRQLVMELSLDKYVSFLGRVEKEVMPDLYRQFDVFLFTSTWQEPFGRVLVEALASGVAVVGTATGGAAEILVEYGQGRPDENALTYAPGDASGLAAQIVCLIEQPALRQRLVENGRRLALEKFDISRMVGEIEAYLSEIVNGTR